MLGLIYGIYILVIIAHEFLPIGQSVALALVLYFLVPTLIREVIYQCITWWATFRPALPKRSVALFHPDVRAVGFPGLGADGRQMLKPQGVFPNAVTLLACPVSAWEPPEIMGPWRIYAPYRINIAQEYDVAHGLAHLREQLKEHSSSRFVLFGSSRGAAVALQVAAALTPIEARRIAMVICEGVFTDVEDVINTRFSSFVQVMARSVLHWFTRYDPDYNDTWSPLAAARTFQHVQLPIVLVTSAADTVVVSQLTTQLANVLRKTANVCHVYEIALDYSPHSDYASHNDEDRATYVSELDTYFNNHNVS